VTDQTDRLRAVLIVTVETKPGGDYYVNHDDFVRHVGPWIEGALEDRDDIRDVTIVEQEPAVVPSAVDRAALLRVVRRIGQMADAWEQQLPEVIRTPAVVSAIRAALEPAAHAACNCDAEVHIGAGFYHQSWCATRQPAAPADRATVLNAAAQRLYTALFPAVYADMGQKAAEGVNRAVSELRRMAAETPQPTPCSEPDGCDPDGDLCDRHETERAHTEGEHAFCGPTCEVEFPSDKLRNTILYRAIPGSAGMLDELLRRAASGQLPAASAPAVVAQPAKKA